MNRNSKTLKNTIKKMKVSSNDVIIIRDNGKESRCPYCGLYKNLIENKYENREVKDCWREGYTVIVVLNPIKKTNEESNLSGG